MGEPVARNWCGQRRSGVKGETGSRWLGPHLRLYASTEPLGGGACDPEGLEGEGCGSLALLEFFLWQHAMDNFLLSYQFMMCDGDSM